MRVLIIILVALLTVVGLTFCSKAEAHPQHGNYVSYTPQFTPQIPKTTKRKGKDAFYGTAQTQAQRDAINVAHKVRLADKSGKGFMADMQLAREDITNRLWHRKR